MKYFQCCVGFLKLFILILEQWKHRKKHEDEEMDTASSYMGETSSVVYGENPVGFDTSSKFVSILMNTFLFVWFVFGNYWVYLYDDSP